MARPPTKFDTRTLAKVRALRARGGTAESIASALTTAGVTGASRSTIGRLLRELAGKRPSARVRAPAVKVDVAPEATMPELEIPRRAPRPDPPPVEFTAPAAADLPTPTDIEGASVEQLDQLQARVEKLFTKAEEEEDAGQMAALLRIILQIQVERRKAAPPPVNDPNDNPDMRALAAQVGERLHDMIDQALGPVA